MQIFKSWQQIHKIKDPIHITIGNFDGLHLGHRELIRQVKEMAGDDKTALLSFDPHPRELFGDGEFKYLADANETAEILESLGLDFWLSLPFTDIISKLSPAEFIDTLRSGLNLQGIVVGFNFHFGNKGSGDAEFLKAYGEVLGLKTSIVPPIMDGDRIVSSTLIRKMLEEGNIEDANRLLGRNYCICGEVVEGFGRGKGLGFPTANIHHMSNKYLPKDGVYAVKVGDYWGAANVGITPTFGKNIPTVEVHLIDYNGPDIYGKRLIVEFISYLRPEIKFPEVHDLIKQIESDIECVRNIVKNTI